MARGDVLETEYIVHTQMKPSVDSHISNPAKESDVDQEEAYSVSGGVSNKISSKDYEGIKEEIDQEKYKEFQEERRLERAKRRAKKKKLKTSSTSEASEDLSASEGISLSTEAIEEDYDVAYKKQVDNAVNANNYKIQAIEKELVELKRNAVEADIKTFTTFNLSYTALFSYTLFTTLLSVALTKIALFLSISIASSYICLIALVVSNGILVNHFFTIRKKREKAPKNISGKIYRAVKTFLLTRPMKALYISVIQAGTFLSLFMICISQYGLKLFFPALSLTYPITILIFVFILFCHSVGKNVISIDIQKQITNKEREEVKLHKDNMKILEDRDRKKEILVNAMKEDIEKREIEVQEEYDQRHISYGKMSQLKKQNYALENAKNSIQKLHNTLATSVNLLSEQHARTIEKYRVAHDQALREKYQLQSKLAILEEKIADQNAVEFALKVDKRKLEERFLSLIDDSRDSRKIEDLIRKNAKKERKKKQEERERTMEDLEEEYKILEEQKRQIAERKRIIQQKEAQEKTIRERELMQRKGVLNDLEDKKLNLRELRRNSY